MSSEPKDTSGLGDIKSLKGMRDGLLKPATSRGRRLAGWLAVGCGLLVLGMALWPGLVQGWGEALGWVFAEQSRFQRSLGRAMSELAAHPGTPWALIGLSFAYGVLHAAGPGHGKVVISTLLVSQPIVRRRALWLSLLAALLQGVSALVLVGLGAGLLDWAGRDVLGQVEKVTLLSHLGVLVLGGLLLWRAARSLWRALSARAVSSPVSGTTKPEASAMQGLAFEPSPGHDHSHSHSHSHSHGHVHSHGHDCGCGHAHGVTAEQASGDWRTMGMAVLAIGLRPCSGAILVLLAALALNMVGSGVLAVLAMSLGTALTVGSVAMATLIMKASGRLAAAGARLGGPHSDGRARRQWPWAALVGLLGGIIITVFGALLVASSLKALDSSTGRGASPFDRSAPGTSLQSPLGPRSSGQTSGDE
ncbi:sodium:proton antiporter [Cobetia sp. LC6]|uniref:nickel/cobalt transporter n=1 Tax=Cobetia sp. LC6 TaxID=3050947 RepID=UPI00255756E1|nr:sodium:proton antiporter [Cobetia sp. LC6]MDL2190660.1 sodium:proton antiporter [Cobetia sp. LC6]